MPHARIGEIGRSSRNGLGVPEADFWPDRRHLPYSPRKASIGSVLDARLAGSAEAASANSSIAMAESASTPGSNGLTSNKKERSKRDAAKAPSKPSPQPTAASLAPELRMSSITPERWKPSAMRTAISCSRNATENAITARSEEHTSELQSLAYLVCRLLLEKKKQKVEA